MKSRAGLVGILVVMVVAIIAGLAVANIIPIGDAQASPMPSGARPSPSVSPAGSSPFAPSPQTTPTSSPMFAGCGPVDESVPLAMRVEAISETGRWWVISVYEDGEILTPAPLPGQYDDGAWMVARRLTKSGVAELRAPLIESGLFDHTATYNPVSLPGVEMPAFGGGGYVITIGSGANAVTVSWTGLFPNDAQYFEPTERTALDPIATRLLAFDSWLSSDGWADRTPCTVEAKRFRVYIDAQPQGGPQSHLPPDIADVAWPLGGDVLSWGADVGYQPPSKPYHVGRCGIIDRASAFDLVAELRAAGAFDPFTFPTTLDGGNYIELWLGDRAANRRVDIDVQPLLPDDSRCTRDNQPYGGGI